MADSSDLQDRLLSPGQKVQLQAAAIAIILELGVYIVLGLLNGFSIVNHWIQQNLVATLFVSLSIVAIAPVYRKTDDKIHKVVKQLSWSGLILVVLSIPTWLYYQFNPPTTGIDRVIQTITYVFFSAGGLQLLLAFTQKNRSQPPPQ